VDDLSSEINLVRVLFAHSMKSQQSAPKDMDSRAQVLRTSLVLGEQFAKLVRVHSTAHDPLAELQDEIEEALDELRKEWGI
jgi:hypothetical protein